MKKISVWDWPVRLGHWTMVAGFVAAWLTAESESLRLVHVAFGGAVFAVALFRLIWGFIGSRYALFTDFVHGPAIVWKYLKSLLHGHPEHHVGHNPAGGWAIVLILGLAVSCGVSGWASYNDVGGELPAKLHEIFTSILLAVIVVHLVGVASGSLLHHENLVQSMLTGHKQGSPSEAIRSTLPTAALVLLIWIVGIVWLVAN
jgi:cytochrome b